MISGMNTAPSLTKLEGEPGENWQPGYYRTIYNGSQMARAAATFTIQVLGITKATTIDDGDIYTRELANEFSQVFTELGGEVVFSGVISRGDANVEPVLTAVAATTAEALYIPLFISEAALIVKQARMMAEFDQINLLGGEVLGTQAFIDMVGQEAVGMYFTSMELPSGPDFDQLSAAYEAAYGEPPGHHGLSFAFDATNLLLHAIESVAVQESDGTLYIGQG